ncbi:SPFH domain-containing protein [Deltaproteobacteria bacterium TL4]
MDTPISINDSFAKFSRLQLVLLGFLTSLVIFNQFLGIYYQTLLFHYLFILYSVVLLIVFQNELLVEIYRRTQLEKNEAEALPFENTQDYQLSSYVFRITPLIATLTLWMAWTFFIYLWGQKTDIKPDLPFSKIYAGVLLCFVFGIYILNRFLLLAAKAMEQTALFSIFPYLRLLLTVVSFQAIFLLLGDLGIVRLSLLLKYSVLVIIFVMLIEYSLNTLFSVYRLKTYPFQVTSLFSSIILPSVFRSELSKLRFVDRIKEQFGINLDHLWFFSFIKAVAFPLFVLQLILFWSMTCLVVINQGEQGIREQLGRPVSATLSSGLYFKWPFPFEKIIVYNTDAIKHQVVGYKGSADVRDLLWGTLHKGTEYHQFLLGDGKELLMINMDVNYKIDDLFQYHYQHHDPENYLLNLSSKTVVEQTAFRNIEELLTLNRNEFAEQIAQEIQKKATAVQLGVKIVDISINEMHPPASLAASYHQVISAKIKASTLKLEAKSDAIRTIAQATMASYNIVDQQKSEGYHKISLARGKVESYLLRYHAYKISPHLFERRLLLTTLQEAFSKAKITIIDHTILTQKEDEEIWLNLNEF